MGRGSGHSIQLRRLTPDDWALWRKLRLQALGDAPYAFSSRLADWQNEGDHESRWRARVAAVPFNVVSYLDRAEAGMVSATALEDEVTELISLWVAPFARGGGMGDTLVGAVLGWAKEQRARLVALKVFDGNVPAINLYRRHGFVDGGQLESANPASPVERKMFLRLER